MERTKPFVEIAGYKLWEGYPWMVVHGGKRWTYGPHTYNPHAINDPRNAEIVQPFPEEERYFVSLGRQRGWIQGGLMDAICLALTFLEPTTVVKEPNDATR